MIFSRFAFEEQSLEYSKGYYTKQQHASVTSNGCFLVRSLGLICARKTVREMTVEDGTCV